jgi:hypothetical protein
MIKYILGLLLLISCGDKEHIEKTYKYSLPNELQNCKIYYLSPGDFGQDMTVIYCPNAITTTSYKKSCGKNCRRTVSNTIIDK